MFWVGEWFELYEAGIEFDWDEVRGDGGGWHTWFWGHVESVAGVIEWMSCGVVIGRIVLLKR